MRTILQTSLVAAAALVAGVAIGNRTARPRPEAGQSVVRSADERTTPDTEPETLADPPGELGEAMAQAIGGSLESAFSKMSDAGDEDDESTPRGAVGKWVEPALATGLPDGLRLRARTGWSATYRWTRENKKLPPGLDVCLEMTGPPAESIVGYGLHWVDAISTSEGEALSAADVFTSCGIIAAQAESKPPSGEEGDEEEEPARVSRAPAPDQVSVFARPPESGTKTEYVLPASFEFAAPEKKAAAIARYEGSLILRRARGARMIVVQDVKSFQGKAIESAELDEAHLRFLVVEGHMDINIECVAGDLRLLGGIWPVDRAGKHLFGSWNHSGDRWFHWSPHKEATGLAFLIYTDLEEVPIRFRFVDIPMPTKVPRRNAPHGGLLELLQPLGPGAPAPPKNQSGGPASPGDR